MKDRKKRISPMEQLLVASTLSITLFGSMSAMAVDPDETPDEQAIEADSDRIFLFEKRKWKVTKKGKIKVCPGVFIEGDCVDGFTGPELIGIPANATKLKKHLKAELNDANFRIDKKTVLPNGELYVFVTFK